MKTALILILSFLLQIGSAGGLNRIGATNRLKRQAEEAYKAGNYKDAANYYQVLILDWGETSDAIELNRAHALFLAKNGAEAAEAYRQIIEGGAGPYAKSVAYQQLGLLASQEEKLPDALQYFKDALKADPRNETARRNYELAWRALDKSKRDPEQPEEEEEKEKPEDKPELKPSEWAMAQKAKADALSRQFRYDDALSLMQKSLQQDTTIAAYNDYIQRLQDIVEIDE